MNTCRFHKGFSLVVFALLTVFALRSLAATAKVEITNNIAPIQIGATVFENDGKKRSPSINIWAPDTGGSGDTVNPHSTWIYDDGVITNECNGLTENECPITFDVQINANRLSGQCDRLCGHIKVSLSRDGKTCRVSQGKGRCGSNGGAPRWTLSGQRDILINRGICHISLNQINIISKTICSCQGERYPCITNVVCVPGTCPVPTPQNWVEPIRMCCRN